MDLSTAGVCFAGGGTDQPAREAGVSYSAKTKADAPSIEAQAGGEALDQIVDPQPKQARQNDRSSAKAQTTANNPQPTINRLLMSVCVYG